MCVAVHDGYSKGLKPRGAGLITAREYQKFYVHMFRNALQLGVDAFGVPKCSVFFLPPV